MATKKTNENIAQYDSLAQQELNSRIVKETDDPTDLGKVDLSARSIQTAINEDPEIKKLNSLMGYTHIGVSRLPSKGRFYAPDMTIRIRAARVGEVHEFSAIDETDVININDKLNYIVQNCINIYYGNTMGNSKDILDMDKLYLIFLVRDLTFPEETLPVPLPQHVCKTGCEQDDILKFRATDCKFEVKTDPFLDKYYDEERRSYVFKTQSYGEIEMRPSTIGINSIMIQWRRDRQREGKPYNNAIVTLLPYFINDWRSLSDQRIFDIVTSFTGWPLKKFTTILNLAEKIDACSIPELVTTCKVCGGEIRVPLNFRFRTRELFIPEISDSTDREFI